MCLTLRIGRERHGRKNPLPFPYSLNSANFAVPSKGKGEIHKRVENRRLSTLLCPRRAGAGVYPLAPRRGYGESPRSAERNSPLRFSEKGCRPDRVNRLRGSSTPLSRCRERSRPEEANTPAAVRAPRSAGAEKDCRSNRGKKPPFVNGISLVFSRPS